MTEDNSHIVQATTMSSIYASNLINSIRLFSSSPKVARSGFGPNMKGMKN